MVPHHFRNTDPYQHQIKKQDGSANGSASNKSQDPDQKDKLDPDPYQFADDKPNFRDYEPI